MVQSSVFLSCYTYVQHYMHFFTDLDMVNVVRVPFQQKMVVVSTLNHLVIEQNGNRLLLDSFVHPIHPIQGFV